MLTDPQEDYKKGWVPFLGQKIYLDSKPLIPRPETEFWAEKAIEEINKAGTMMHHSAGETPETIHVLDLFAGSGAIGIAVLAHCPSTSVTFGELEEKHFPTIKKSLRKNNIDPNRATVVKTDVWSGIDGKFDVVLANPPYISRERNTVHESVLKHEPHEALFAKNDGLEFIEEMIKGLPGHLNEEEGRVWIEHEPYQTKQVHQLFMGVNIRSEVLKDQYVEGRITRGFTEGSS